MVDRDQHLGIAEANDSARLVLANHREAEHLLIEVDGTLRVRDMNADVIDVRVLEIKAFLGSGGRSAGGQYRETGYQLATAERALLEARDEIGNHRFHGDLLSLNVREAKVEAVLDRSPDWSTATSGLQAVYGKPFLISRSSTFRPAVHSGTLRPMSLSDLHKKPGHLIRRLQQIAVALFVMECEAFDLTPIQYASLTVIREVPDLDATRLSSLVALDRATLAKVIERLAAKGWIVLTTSPLDKRVKLLRVTPKVPNAWPAPAPGAPATRASI